MEELIKKLKEVELYDPQDLKMVSNGYGEFPNSYILSERGIEKMVKLMNWIYMMPYLKVIFIVCGHQVQVGNYIIKMDIGSGPLIGKV